MNNKLPNPILVSKLKPAIGKISFGLFVVPFANAGRSPLATMDPSLIAIMLDKDGKVINNNVIFYNNEKSDCRNIWLSNELYHHYETKININWNKVPSNCDSIHLIIDLFANDDSPHNATCLSECHEIKLDLQSGGYTPNRIIDFANENLKGLSCATLVKMNRKKSDWEINFVSEKLSGNNLEKHLVSKGVQITPEVECEE